MAVLGGLFYTHSAVKVKPLCWMIDFLPLTCLILWNDPMIIQTRNPNSKGVFTYFQTYPLLLGNCINTLFMPDWHAFKGESHISWFVFTVSSSFSLFARAVSFCVPIRRPVREDLNSNVITSLLDQVSQASHANTNAVQFHSFSFPG